MYKLALFKLNNTKIVKFIKLSGYKKWLFVETFFWLFLFRFIIVVIPLGWYNRLLLGKKIRDPEDVFCQIQNPVIDNIALAIKFCNRYVPWKNKCLAAAISARIMLLLRGYNSTLYLGVKKDGNSSLSSHSWLRCGEKYVAGGTGKGYVIVSKFR